METIYVSISIHGSDTPAAMRPETDKAGQSPGGNVQRYLWLIGNGFASRYWHPPKASS